jgi:hypothetical protein
MKKMGLFLLARGISYAMTMNEPKLLILYMRRNRGFLRREKERERERERERGDERRGEKRR